MRKVKYYKCPVCGRKFKKLGGWISHVESNHPTLIPENMTPSQYFYYLQTGKDSGHCVVCKRPTEWVEASGKYARLCKDPKCKEKLSKDYSKNVMAVYGTDNLFALPEFQKKCLSRRKISGKVTWWDGAVFEYVGSYEKDFQENVLSGFLQWNSEDWIIPSPNTYRYEYDGKEHFYIPDAYCISMDAEIERKDDDNNHPHIKVDREKDKLKEAAVRASGRNYCKVSGKDNYAAFFEFLLSFKEKAIEENSNSKTRIQAVTESIEVSSEEEALALESSLIDNPYYERFSVSAYEEFMEENKYEIIAAETTYENNGCEDIATEALIGVNDIGLTSNESAIVAIVKGFKWAKKVGIVDAIGAKVKSLFTGAKIKDGNITINGLDHARFFARLSEKYENTKLDNIFIKEYNKASLKKYEAKKISRKEMKIDKLRCPEFFVIELIQLFREMGEEYNDCAYMKIAKDIYKKSWLAEADNAEVPELSLDPLKQLSPKYILKPWQVEFIKNYNKLKSRLNLNGYILAFDPGLGKTLTSISLSLCLKKEKVYIICPNALKENWAIEIRNYFPEYVNQDRWHKEVCIIGSKDFPATTDTKYFICNNEAMVKLKPYLDPKSNNMLIIDESQNFRNYKGTRTADLLNVAQALKCTDIIPCSGTPVKANPTEIVPILALLDPTFTTECAELYTKAFNSDTLDAISIINHRFGNIMYRRTKAELDTLPRKFEENLFLNLSNAKEYLVDHVSELIRNRFIEIYTAKQEKNKALRQEFIEMHDKYTSAPKQYQKLFKENVIDIVNTEKLGKILHESEVEILDNYKNNYLFPNIPERELKRCKKLYTDFVMMEKQAKGEAMGEILPKYRTQMFIDLYEEDKDELIERFKNNTKKTVIFSPFLGVVNYICKDLNANGVGCVKVTGEQSDKLTNILRFKEDDTVTVLIATSQTLGTGVTLTEANQLFFFGTPWRSTDYKQASDRIHRIGQTDEVTIYNVLLRTSAKNLSTRMLEILQWSDEMFSGIVDSDMDPELATLAMESYSEFRRSCDIIVGTKNPIESIRLSEDEGVSLMGFYNRARATSWGLFELLESIKDDFYEEYQEQLNVGWDFLNHTFYYENDQLDKIIEYLGKNNIDTIYLYTIANKDLQLGRTVEDLEDEDRNPSINIYSYDSAVATKENIEHYGVAITECNDEMIYKELIETVYDDFRKQPLVEDVTIINLSESNNKLIKDVYIGFFDNEDIKYILKNHINTNIPVNKLNNIISCIKSYATIGTNNLDSTSTAIEACLCLGANDINDYDSVALESFSEYYEVLNPSTESESATEYERKPLTQAVISEYKESFSVLKRIRINDKTKGYLLFDNEKQMPVGVVNVEEQNFNNRDCVMITAIEVNRQYRGEGVGKLLVDIACNDLNADTVTVRKSNVPAISLYKSKDWVITGKTEYEYIMRPKKFSHLDGDISTAEESVLTPSVQIATVRGIGVESGFTNNGIWNSVIDLKGKKYRHRVEMILIDEKTKKIFMDKRGNKYRIPGGSVEPKVSNLQQAINEVNEEARLNVKHVGDTGFKYFRDYENSTTPKYLSDSKFKYDGVYTEVYVGFADGPYKGFVAEADRDESMFLHGRFYDYEEVKNILRPEHKNAYNNFIKETINMSAATEAKLTTAERKALPDSAFGLPDERKYPLVDEEHIQDAIAFFHFCKGEEKRRELAKNIMKEINKKGYKIEIGEKSLIRKYM